MADAYTVLLLHCNGTDASTTFTDSSPSAHTVTAQVNAQLDTAQKKFGTASYLNDTSSMLTSADSADWDFGTGDFTIDYWIRWNSVGSDVYIIGRAPAGSIKWQAYYNGNVQFQIMGANRVNQAWSPSTATWYHMAFVRSGTNCYVFIDGTQLGSTGTDSADIQGTTGIGLGMRSDGPIATGLDGWLDEVRVSKGIARWTANFTPPSDEYDAVVLMTTWFRGLPLQDASRTLILQ